MSLKMVAQASETIKIQIEQGIDSLMTQSREGVKKKRARVMTQDEIDDAIVEKLNNYAKHEEMKSKKKKLN